MQIKNKKIKEHITFFDKSIVGDDYLAFYFSTKGTFDFGQTIYLIFTLNAGLILLKILNFLPVMILGSYIDFYCSFVAIQKRCKDFGSKGTIYLIIFSIFYPVIRIFGYFGFINKEMLNIPDYLYLVIYVIYIIYWIVLLLKPPSKEKNPNIISPIFKHPIIYFSICIVLSLIFYVVMYQMYVE